MNPSTTTTGPAAVPGTGSLNPATRAQKAIADYHAMRPPKNEAERKTQAAMLGLDPNVVTNGRRNRAAEPASTRREQGPVCCLADVEPEIVEWLWTGRIPFGKLTIIEGHPSTGKSHLTLEIAACISTGKALPGNSWRAPGNVLVIGCEDGLGDTVRPRLDAAGAALGRVFALRGIPDENGGFRLVSLPDDVWQLELWVEQYDVDLLILDPMNAFLGDSVDNYKDHHVRRALTPLAEMAERMECAVVLVRHLTKSPSARAITAGGGSIGIIGLARSALLVSEDPEDPERRVIAQTKNNLARLAPSLAFRLTESPGKGSRIAWDGESHHTADSLIAAGAEMDEVGGQLDTAKQLLPEWLAGGLWVPKQEVELLARKEGISSRTLQRASQGLGVEHQKEGFGPKSRMMWRLPESHTRRSSMHGVHGMDRTSEPFAGAEVSHTRQSIRANEEVPALARMDGATLPENPAF